jgi:hypothetical protein
MRVLVIAWLCISTAERGEAAPRHVRFKTTQGPVHVWTPAKYDRATAGIVIYVHGFYVDVDRAWKRHRLPKQFAASAINALFIACEAPDRPRDDVNWTSIAELLAEVARHAELPEGRVVAVGHSGAHRTLSLWMAEDVIDTIVLVDALYGDIPKFRDWLDADPDRRLIDAAALTRPWTDALHAELPETLVFKKFPPAKAGKLRGARRARVVYVHSQHDHMRLVTGGIALPLLLRALQLRVVKGASRTARIRRL